MKTFNSKISVTLAAGKFVGLTCYGTNVIVLSATAGFDLRFGGGSTFSVAAASFPQSVRADVQFERIEVTNTSDASNTIVLLIGSDAFGPN